MNVKRLTALLTLSLAILCLGCPSQPKPTTGPAERRAAKQAERAGQPARTFTIGMSQCNLGEPWRVQMNKDVEEAARKHPELQISFKDAQNKTEVQQAQVREFVAQGVDLLIISPKEALPLTKPVAEAYDKGIPVIVLDRKVQGDKFTCFIGGDNVMIGREAGKFLVKKLGPSTSLGAVSVSNRGKGSIVELKGLMTSTPGQERHDGFMEGIKGSDLKIIFDADCHWLEPDAQKEMNSALSRFDRIDAVYAHNDPSAHGAYLAAKQEGKGREKKIVFIGIDALPHEGIKYVEQGILAATFQYPTGGADAIDIALKILNGEEVPKNIILGTRLFTKDTLPAGQYIAPGEQS